MNMVTEYSNIFHLNACIFGKYDVYESIDNNIGVTPLDTFKKCQVQIQNHKKKNLRSYNPNNTINFSALRHFASANT